MDKKHNFSFRWTQPYPNWQGNSLNRKRQIQMMMQLAQTIEELLVIKEVDELVDSRLTYPEAHSIIKHIANKSKE